MESLSGRGEECNDSGEETEFTKSVSGRGEECNDS